MIPQLTEVFDYSTERYKKPKVRLMWSEKHCEGDVIQYIGFIEYCPAINSVTFSSKDGILKRTFNRK